MCDTIRNHLSNLSKYKDQRDRPDITQPDTMQLYLETRFEQLKVAMIGSLVTCGVAPIPGGFIVWIYMVCFLKDFCRKHEGFCVKF